MKYELNDMQEFSEFNIFLTSTWMWFWFIIISEQYVHTLTYFEKYLSLSYFVLYSDNET
jgi:hypothetical protein